ncbi:MAG: trypsin-like peptidase domain-containing protein [Candidatus Saccharibacteria bacterium]|nr:trypsin-like peptidase domain-containing protein [Candidatus Saccharibacteria bacterium]
MKEEEKTEKPVVKPVEAEAKPAEVKPAEAKVEAKTEAPKPKRKKAKKIILAVCLILLAVATGLIIWAAQAGKLEFITKLFNPQSDTSQVELKRTEPIAAKSEGTYIIDVSDVVDAVMPSIVAITSKTVIDTGRFGSMFYGGSYVAEGAGSGVIISENNDSIFVLTNYHVVEGANELSVKFIDDSSADASIKGVSQRKDVAIVSVGKDKLTSETLSKIKLATIGNSDELKVGNGVIAIGNALGYGQSVTTGVVSALNREVSTDTYVQDMIQTDAAINGGNSGGALLNSKGEVVGINAVKYSSNGYSSDSSIEGMGFAIPMSVITPILDKLINSENDDGLTLGVEGYMTNSGAISSYKLPTGLYLSAIASNSNAEKAGLEIGNIITHIDGSEVTSIDSLKKVLNKKEKGDKITLKIKYASHSEYREKDVVVTLQ